jgi:hypothetical protein
MYEPSDSDHSRIDINSLEVDPSLDMEDAVELARELGADHAILEDEYALIDTEFVVDVIQFSPGELFGFDSTESSTIHVNEVAQQTIHSRGLCVRLADASPGERDYEPMEWTETPWTYADLWLAWLQGRVFPVTRETTYRRADTDEEIAV